MASKTFMVGIEHGVMLREVRDELVHLRLVGRELARVLGDLDEAVHVARLLDLSNRKLSSMKLRCWISSAPASTNCRARHERRHVAADAQAARVRAVGDQRHELGGFIDE